MTDLIEMEDLDKIAGYYIEPNDPSLCECGSKAAGKCLGMGNGCPMWPEMPDERFPSAETRWYLGY